MKKIITIFFVLASFSFLVAQTTLTTPANHSYKASLTPTLTWGTTTGPYTLKVYKDGAMTNEVLSQVIPDGTTTYTFGTALAYNTKYYWRVQDNSALWSPLWDFTTKLSAVPVQTHPLDASVQLSKDVSVFWYSGMTSVTYDLQVRTAAPADDTPDYTVTGGYTYKALTGLTTGQTYHWRVRTKLGSNYSDWSTTWTFTISPTTGAVASTLTYPIGGTTVYTDVPYLYWYTMSSATGLSYRISMKEGLGAYAVLASNHASTFYQVPAGLLGPGKTYTWKVETSADGGVTYPATSVEETFVTTSALPNNAIQPTVSWPVDNAGIYGTSTYLYWYLGTTTSPGLTFEYELQPVASAFTGTPTATGITDLFVEVTGLTPNTAYKWQVRSRFGMTASAWSTTATFTTMPAFNAAPAKPILSWPVDNALVYTLSPDLNWYTGAYQASATFELQYGTNPDTTIASYTDVLPVPVTGITELTKKLSGLSPGTTYYWRVRTKIGTDYSAWSYFGSFTIVNNPNEGPQKPLLSWPIGLASVSDITPTLSWYIVGSSTGITYELSYKLDSQDWSAATVVPGLATTTYDIPAPLTQGEVYRWRVRTQFNASLWSAYSDEDVFIVDPAAAAMLPINGSPANGITLPGTALNLSWFIPNNSASVKYNLVIADNPSLTNPKVSATGLSAAKYSASLDANKTYYWAVKSVTNDGKESAYSKKGTFSLTSATDVQETAIPEKFDVAQNYPNPFNPTTNIKIYLPAKSFVTVKIYNAIGQQVKTLTNNEFAAGSHTLIWNGTNDMGKTVSSGVYFYRVTNGSNIVTKKMMFIK